MPLFIHNGVMGGAGKSLAGVCSSELEFHSGNIRVSHVEVPGSCQGDWGLSSKERKELQASMGSHRPGGSCRDDREDKEGPGPESGRDGGVSSGKRKGMVKTERKRVYHPEGQERRRFGKAVLASCIRHC